MNGLIWSHIHGPGNIHRWCLFGDRNEPLLDCPELKPTSMMQTLSVAEVCSLSFSVGEGCPIQKLERPHPTRALERAHGHNLKAASTSGKDLRAFRQARPTQ